jgi:hypothetical protein
MATCKNGAWQAAQSALIWEQGVAGSNPAVPTGGTSLSSATRSPVLGRAVRLLGGVDAGRDLKEKVAEPAALGPGEAGYGGDAGEQGGDELLAEVVAGVGEDQLADAAVGGEGPAFDQAPGFQAGGHGGDVAGIAAQGAGQAGHGHRAVEVAQGQGLGGGQAEGGRDRVEVGLELVDEAEQGGDDLTTAAVALRRRR